MPPIIAIGMLLGVPQIVHLLAPLYDRSNAQNQFLRKTTVGMSWILLAGI